jgi:mono/diheme cytochrome c family protein
VRRGLGLVAAVLVPLGAAAQTPGNPEHGETLYREKCALCHGAQGQGWDWATKVERPPVPVPDLAEAAPTRSDQYLFDIVREGGEAVGRTRFMPPFGFQLSDQEVWDVVAYLRTLRAR